MRAWWRRHELTTHLVLLPLGLLMASPFFWMLGTSLKTREETSRLWPIPAVPQWHNYVDAWHAAPFARYFMVSGVTAGVVTVAVLLTALLAGYAFGALEWRGKNGLFAIYLATMMVPFEVILIPNFLLVQRLGWVDSFAALIVPWASSVFAVFLVTQSFRALPRDFYEAAVIDGCGHWQYLWRIAGPLVAPALATAAIFAFLGSWNSLLWPVVAINSEAMRTVEMGLSMFLQEEQANNHLLMAASVLCLLPVLLLFLAMQRRFIEGLAAGVKG